MPDLKKNIEELSRCIFEDVETLRSYDSEKVNKRIGSEVMSLNALVNAYKAMNEKG